MQNHLLTRRTMTALCAGAALAPRLALAADKPFLKRPIPHGGELLPAVGLGTDSFDEAGRAALDGVIRALLAQGGSVIDTAPSYGSAERMIGDIVAAQNARGKCFIATKVEYYRPGAAAQGLFDRARSGITDWIAPTMESIRAEARASLQQLKTGKLDLLQLHNVSDPGQDMGELNALKTQGLCRYTGITTTDEGDYAVAEAIIRRTRPDFLEIDYAIDNRAAEQRVLPAARDAGTAVLVARPFGSGSLFRDVQKKPLPDFAAEIDCASWAQFFLKFILGHPAVTAAIPGTTNPAHVIDDLGGGRGAIPDAKMRARMVQYVSGMF